MSIKIFQSPAENTKLKAIKVNKTGRNAGCVWKRVENTREAQWRISTFALTSCFDEHDHEDRNAVSVEKVWQKSGLWKLKENLKKKVSSKNYPFYHKFVQQKKDFTKYFSIKYLCKVKIFLKYASRNMLKTA